MPDHNHHITKSRNYRLEINDKKMREVTIEWRIHSSAASNRCFTPDFPISEGKTLLERNSSVLSQVWVHLLGHITQAPNQTQLRSNATNSIHRTKLFFKLPSPTIMLE